MSEEQMDPPPPMVETDGIEEIADRVYWIPDRSVDFVPNIGIVVGDRSALVVDTGMGPRNGERVVEQARQLAGDRQLYLTVTHFHPEHGYGAQSFAGEATIFYTQDQEREFTDKRDEYLEMFTGFGPHLATLLREVEFVHPDLVHAGDATLDLGGVGVVVEPYGPAHTRGDLTVHLPEQRVLFAGDLVLNGFLPILPDGDATGTRWLEMLRRLRGYDVARLVPGHGDADGSELVDGLITYFEYVRDRVGQLASDPGDLERVAATLEPEVATRYEGWRNQEWIRSAIESFHRELTR